MRTRRLEQRDDPLQTALIFLVERVEPIRVDVEDADQIVTGVEHGHDDLGLRIRIAGDVSGELMHVRNDERLSLRGGGPANALAHLDLQATDGPDVRADDQAIAGQAIKAGPEVVVEFVGEDGVDRRHQRDVVESRPAFISPDGDDRIVAFVVRNAFQRLRFARTGRGAGRRMVPAEISRSVPATMINSSMPSSGLSILHPRCHEFLRGEWHHARR
jgi:hypothetical protein